MNVELKYGMVFHNQHNGNTFYSVSDSSKNVDGSYTNRSWNVRFKGNVPQDRSKINLKGFMSYFRKEERTYDTIQVMEWEYCEQPQQTQEESMLPF